MKITSAVAMAVSVPGMIGSPALVAASRAATLSPILKRIKQWFAKNVQQFEIENLMTCAKMSNLKTKGTELIVWKEEMSILNAKFLFEEKI